MNKTPQEIYPDGPVYVLGLKTPIPKTDPAITELKFWRRIKVADLIAMEQEGLDGYAKTVDILRRTTLIATSDLHQLDAFDFMLADKVAAGFLLHGPNDQKGSSGSPSSQESSDSP